MKYRRSLFIIMLLVMLTFIACNNVADNEEKIGTENTQTETLKEKKTSRKKKQRDKDESKVEESRSLTLPHIIIGERRNTSNEYHWFTRTAHLYLKEEEEFKQLNNAFEKYNSQVDKELEGVQQDLNQMAEDMKGLSSEYLDTAILTDETYVNIIRADNSIVSVLKFNVVYYGGAHPDSMYSSHNFDTKTGDELKFSDMVKNTSEFLELLDAEFNKNYSDRELLMPSQYINEYKKDDLSDLAWTVNGEGVSIYFNAYDLGSYADGSQVLTVYFDEGKDLFNEAYVNSEIDYVLPLQKWDMIINPDVDGDGKREPVHVEDTYDESYSNYMGLGVFIGDRSIICPGDNGEAYIVRKDGKYYMYVFLENEDMEKVLSVVNLNTLEYERDRASIVPSTLEIERGEEGDENFYTELKEAFTDVNLY